MINKSGLDQLLLLRIIASLILITLKGCCYVSPSQNTFMTSLVCILQSVFFTFKYEEGSVDVDVVVVERLSDR